MKWLASLLLGVTLAAPAEPVFVPKTWFADERTVGDKIETRITNRWINYYDGQKWQKINRTPVQDFDGFHWNEMPYGLDLPATSRGAFTFTSNNKFDTESGAALTEEPLVKHKTFRDIADVPGVPDYGGCTVLYPNAFPQWNADLCEKVTGQEVRHLIRFNAEPSGTGDILIRFRQTFDESVTVNHRGKTKGSDYGSGAEIKRGKRRIIMEEAAVWDSSSPPKNEKIKIQGFFNASKVIPRSFLDSAQYPVFTDTVDTFTSSTDDQEIISDGSPSSSWSTVRNGTALSLGTLSDTNARAIAQVSGSSYFIYRSYLQFPTGSVIPSGDSVTAVTLALRYPSTNSSGFSTTQYVVRSRQAASSVATTDFNLIGDSGVGNGTIEGQNTRANGAGASTQTMTLNANIYQYIAKGSGNTYLAVLESTDWDNSTPTKTANVGTEFSSGDTAGTANDPTLTVTHAPSSTFTPIIIQLF